MVQPKIAAYLPERQAATVGQENHAVEPSVLAFKTCQRCGLLVLVKVGQNVALVIVMRGMGTRVVEVREEVIAQGWRGLTLDGLVQPVNRARGVSPSVSTMCTRGFCVSME